MADQHARLAPSGSHRWMNCPGSIPLSDGIEDTDSEYSREGTCAHHVAEIALIAGTNAGISEGYLRERLTKNNGDPSLADYFSDTMLNHIETYLEAIHRDLLESGLTSEALQVETKLDMNWLVPGMFGKCDASFGEDFGILKVYDLKYGMGVVVEPQENPQQMIYALGCLGENNPHEYQEVEIVIVQPRIPHAEGVVRRWRISVEDLYHWAYNVLQPAAALCDGEDPDLKVGDWCQFCPILAQCPEMAKETLDSAMVEFGEIDGQEAIKIPSPELLTETQIGRVLSLAKIIGSWAKEVEAFALARMESGVPIPGFKLIETRGNRKWKDEDQVINTLEWQFGRDIYNEALRSPAQMEKLIGIDKKALEPLWETGEVRHAVAPDKDRRPNVEPSAQVEFGIVNEGGEDFLA